MNVEEIKSKGYMRLHEPGIKDLIQIDQFKLAHYEERLRDNGELDVDPELAARMKTAALFLQEKYLNSTFDSSQYKKFLVWDGVDKDNQLWHTDSFEGMNCFFLYYFDEMREETGGSIQFMRGTDIDVIYPRSGDLFLVNNGRGFFHRAEQCTIQRRVASWDFQVTGLNELG